MKKKFCTYKSWFNIKKYLSSTYFKPLQNLEALGLVGGKPFNIENNFLVDPKTFKIIKEWEDGGSIDYALGDEIDEATMKKLEKLGYTFEKYSNGKVQNNKYSPS